jgi:hypothetical protein
MSEFIHAGYGPGGIAAMQSGYGLSRPPTISSTTRPVDIGASLYAQPGMSGCVGCLGTNGNGNGAPAAAAAANGLRRYLVPVGIGALGFLAVTYFLKR